MGGMSSTIQPGDRVLYVPEPDVHWSDRDGGGSYAFTFNNEDGTPADVSRGLHRDGNILHTGNGKPIWPGRPKSFWPATVTACHDDGTCTLEIKNPHSATLGYRRRHSATKEPGTFHREGE